MNRWEYLALALELWTAVGLLGLAISLMRRERRRLVQGVASLVVVWAVYLLVLVAVARWQPGERVKLGEPACFHALCYTVARVEEVPGFRDGSRLVRLTVHVANRGTGEAAEEVVPYLRDAQGRTWLESAGVSGNPLSGRVLAGQTVVSEPVFAVARDATGLGMVLTHGRWSPHALVIGDPESWGHRPRVLLLEAKAS